MVRQHPSQDGTTLSTSLCLALKSGVVKLKGEDGELKMMTSLILLEVPDLILG